MRKISITVMLLIVMFLLGTSFYSETTVELPDMLVPASVGAGSLTFTETQASAELASLISKTTAAVDHASKQSVRKLEAEVIATGSALNTSSGRGYDITLTGEDPFIVPLYVDQAGIFRFSVKEKGSKNTKLLNISIFQDKECKNLIKSFTFDRGKAAKMIGGVPFPKKGNYYLKFKANAFQKTETSVFLFTSSFLQGGDRTLLKNETIYTGTGSKKPIYYKTVLDKDTVLALKGKQYLAKGKIFVSLCDSKKKKLTKESLLLSDETIYFPAEKGTYWIEVQTEAEIIFTMKSMEIPISDRSASEKEKAFLLKEAKRETGMFLAVDQKISEKWYKIKLKKNDKVTVECFGGVSPSGTIRIEFFDGNGTRFGERILTKRNEDLSFCPSITYKGKNVKKNGYLPAGTYYIKITNTEKETDGYYSLQYQIQPLSKK